MRVLLNDPDLGLVCVAACELYFQNGNLVVDAVEHYFEIPMSAWSSEALLLKAFQVGHLDLREFPVIEEGSYE